MPLVARLPAAHSIRDFLAAGRLRYHEGMRLAAAGDRLAAIYLWGYTAEMLLKAAYFRLIGWSPAQVITVAHITTAKNYAMAQLGIAWPSNLHDISRWRELLVEQRLLRHVPFGAGFARSLNARVSQIFVNWREHLRYHSNRPYQGEVARVFQGVTWLMGQRHNL